MLSRPSDANGMGQNDNNSKLVNSRTCLNGHKRQKGLVQAATMDGLSVTGGGEEAMKGRLQDQAAIYTRCTALLTRKWVCCGTRKTEQDDHRVGIRSCARSRQIVHQPAGLILH